MDSAFHPLRDRLMCHLFSPDLSELHALAERIGIQRRWFQDPATMPVSWPHYDIDATRRLLAINRGATLEKWVEANDAELEATRPAE